MANHGVNGNKRDDDASVHADPFEGFDATSFFLSDAEDHQLGDRPSLSAAERARGVDSAMAKAIRDYAIKERLACFKIRVNRGPLMDSIIEGITKTTEIALCTAAEVAPACEAIPVKGIDGEGTGAVRYIFFPASQVPQLATIKEFKEQQSGCFKTGADGLQVTITRDRMMGSRGKTEFAVDGLKSTMVKRFRGFPVAAAVASDLLIAEWASQFDTDPDEARFQLVSNNIGQAMGPFGLVQIFDYFVEFAAEAHSSAGTGASQRTQVHKLDWNKLAARAGLEEGDVAKMTREQIYSQHARDLKAEISSGSNDSEICKRTLVGFNIAPGTTEEQIKAALTSSADIIAKTEEEKIKEDDIEEVEVRETGAGNCMFKARIKDLQKFEIAYMVEGAKPLQDLHDGKGNQGVRLARDKTIAERRKIYQNNSRRVSSWSGAGNNAPKQVWKNDMMPEAIDYGKLAEKVSAILLDKLMTEFTKPQGVFMKAIAGVLAARLQTLMSPLRERLTSIEINIASIAQSVGSDQFNTNEEEDFDDEEEDFEMGDQTVLGKRGTASQDQLAVTVAQEMAGNPAMMSQMLQLVEAAAQNTPAGKMPIKKRPTTGNRR